MNETPKANTAEAPLPFTPEEAISYIANRIEPMPPTIDPLKASSWRCVDGRCDGEYRFAGPGGALGIAMAIFTAAHEQSASPEEYETVWNSITQSMGGMTAHTDEHKEHDPLVYAGCGHCSGMTNMDLYGIKDLPFMSFIATKMSTEIDRSQNEVLRGDHGERAVAFIAGTQFTLPALAKDGTQIFVVHFDTWLDAVEKISREVANALGVDTDVLAHAARGAAERQAYRTFIRLAKDKPLILVAPSEDNPEQPTVTAVAPDASSFASQALENL